MCNRTSYRSASSALAVITSLVTENSEQGASATRTPAGVHGHGAGDRGGPHHRAAELRRLRSYT
ncbi:hypothetical protein [Streptomyces sp. NPDC054794]